MDLGDKPLYVHVFLVAGPSSIESPYYMAVKRSERGCPVLPESRLASGHASIEVSTADHSRQTLSREAISVRKAEQRKAAEVRNPGGAWRTNRC